MAVLSEECFGRREKVINFAECVKVARFLNKNNMMYIFVLAIIIVAVLVVAAVMYKVKPAND